MKLTIKDLVKLKILLPYNPATRSVVLNKERSGSHTRGYLAMSEGLFGYHIWGCKGRGERVGILQSVGRAAKHPTVNRSSLPTKNYLTQNVNSGKVGKL